jgi:hypothetical protein
MIFLFILDCSILTGSHSIHGHSEHNKTHFGGDELELTYGVPWAKFADTVIPRMCL